MLDEVLRFEGPLTNGALNRDIGIPISVLRALSRPSLPMLDQVPGDLLHLGTAALQHVQGHALSESIASA